MKSAMLAILSGVSWGASAIVAKRLYTVIRAWIYYR